MLVRQELIKETEQLLKDALMMKHEIEVYKNINNDSNEEKRIEGYIIKLHMLVDALPVLRTWEQQVLESRYFENKTYKETGRLIGYSGTTAKLKIERAILSLGRIIFGMEKEFSIKYRVDVERKIEV